MMVPAFTWQQKQHVGGLLVVIVLPEILFLSKAGLKMKVFLIGSLDRILWTLLIVFICIYLSLQ